MQDWKDRKKQKENHATKVTKIPKTKRRKYGTAVTEFMKSLDEVNTKQGGHKWSCQPLFRQKEGRKPKI